MENTDVPKTAIISRKNLVYSLKPQPHKKVSLTLLAITFVGDSSFMSEQAASESLTSCWRIR